jgi:hypothetical protein
MIGLRRTNLLGDSQLNKERKDMSITPSTMLALNKITDDNIKAFSDDPQVQELAKTAVMYFSIKTSGEISGLPSPGCFGYSPKQIPPIQIYCLSRLDPKTGEIPETSVSNLRLWSSVAFHYYGLIQVNLVTLHTQVDKFKKHYPEVQGQFEYAPHHIYDYRPPDKSICNGCHNPMGNIRNSIIRHATKATATAIPFFHRDNWIVMVDDDMYLNRVTKVDFNQDNIVQEIKQCTTADELIIALLIWYYLTFSIEINVRPVGISGFATYQSLCKPVIDHGSTPYSLKSIKDDIMKNSTVYGKIRVDNTRLTNMVLLNISKMFSNGIRYETEWDLWEDLDINLQFAINGLHNIGIIWPISMGETRKMAGKDAVVEYNIGKINNLAIGMYEKWGNLVKFRVMDFGDGQKAVNTKLPDFNGLVNNSGEYQKKPWFPYYNDSLLHDARLLRENSGLTLKFINDWKLD